MQEVNRIGIRVYRKPDKLYYKDNNYIYSNNGYVYGYGYKIRMIDHTAFGIELNSVKK